MLRRVRPATGAVAVLLFVCSSAVSSANPLPDAIRALERDGKFDDAKRLLASMQDEDATKHAALLADVERLEGIANDYVADSRYAEAQRALSGLLPTLDPVRDSYLVLRVQRTIDRLRREFRSQQEQDALAMLDRADGLYARSAFARARAVYEAVAMQSVDDVGTAVLTRAKRGVAKSQRAALDDEPATLYDEVLHPVPGAARTVTIWTIWMVVLAVAFVVLRALHGRLFTRDGHVVNLVDLTASTELRAAANHELSRALIQTMNRIGRAEPRAATLQAAAAPASAQDDWTPGERLPFIDATPDAPALSTLTEFVQATPTVQVGPIGINPRQVMELGQALFRPRYRHTLSGTLFENDGALVLHAAMYDRRKRTAAPWHASVTASAGRASCLADVAAQVVVAMSNEKVLTSNAQSLRQYVAGLDALTGATSDPASLAPARQAFQRSIDADRDNWLARFHLAIVFRRLGDAGAAIHHLRTLRDRPSDSLRDHLRTRPDFGYLVLYQLGSALTQSGGSDDVTEAEACFDQLIKLGAGEDNPLKPYVPYLRMLGRSGETSLLLADLDHSDKGEVLDRVSAHEQWFDDKADELIKTWPEDYQIARGVVKYGFGRLQYVHGNYREAMKPLREATMLVPDFADAYVNLAQVYLKWKEKTSDDWPRSVRAALDRALAIEPHHDKAKYIYAKFYFTDAARDLAAAEKLLKECALHPSTLFLLGRVLVESERFADALDALDRSLSLDDRADYRIQLYGKTTLDLVRTKGPVRTVSRARDRFVGYIKAEKDQKDLDRLNALLKQIDDAIAGAKMTPAQPPAQPSAAQPEQPVA
jgi:tetratricopeptide (TPR) repeat protein